MDHAKQEDVHIICFDHIESFLDSVYKATNFYDPMNFLSKIFKSKYETCPSCGSNLSFLAIYSCSMGYKDDYSRTFVEQTIDNFEDYYIPKAGSPPVSDQLICRRCGDLSRCDGFYRTYDVVCMKCGWVESSRDIHPCSLAISKRWVEKCEDCYRPYECENYEDLISQNKICIT